MTISELTDKQIEARLKEIHKQFILLSGETVSVLQDVYERGGHDKGYYDPFSIDEYPVLLNQNLIEKINNKYVATELGKEQCELYEEYKKLYDEKICREWQKT